MLPHQASIKIPFTGEKADWPSFKSKFIASQHFGSLLLPSEEADPEVKEFKELTGEADEAKVQKGLPQALRILGLSLVLTLSDKHLEPLWNELLIITEGKTDVKSLWAALNGNSA